jgi:glycosyltransferase involved in cell wall biosynthesis
MDMKINISVIIPVYNAGGTIERAVNSITIHEYEPLEVILVDDGSTDNSGNLCDYLFLCYNLSVR